MKDLIEGELALSIHNLNGPTLRRDSSDFEIIKSSSSTPIDFYNNGQADQKNGIKDRFF